MQMLQLRMEAQKDLLRQDASAAVASLENELASAIGAHEACKQELAGVESRAAKLTKDLHIAEGDVDTLERTRDRLTAERDEQATRLDALESAQEQSERDVDELQEALSVATSELTVLREVRAACDRIKGDLVHMRGLREIEEAAKMAEDSGGAFTVEVVVVEGKGETTVVTPNRKSKSKAKGSASTSGKGKPANAQALAERFASWCRGENTARQLKLASLPLLARGVSVLGSQFEANTQTLERTVREKEVVRRSLQEEIFSLRSQLETTRDSESRLSEAEANHKVQIRDLSEELKDTQNEFARTSADLDRAEASGESLRMLLEDRERTLGLTEETLARAQNDLEARTLERNENLAELEGLRDEHVRLKGEHALLGEETTRHKDEVARLRKDVATRRKDFAALQEGHLRDREVLHEKVQPHVGAVFFPVPPPPPTPPPSHCLPLANTRHLVSPHPHTPIPTTLFFPNVMQISRSEATETQAFEKAQSLGVQVAQLEAKVSRMSALLADESTSSQRATGELRHLREELHLVSAEREKLSAQLEADRRSNTAEKDAMETRNAGLEARLRALVETKGITDSTVVSLTTEVESIRRTILRAVDDVCTRYGHESQPIAGFAANRGTGSPGRRSRSNSPSRNSAMTPGRSIAAPQIEGVRGAVRQMSALLHSLAAGSVTLHNLEASQLATVRSQSTATEAELRRAQELLSQARAQHASVVQTTSANLEGERERNRQLEALVERLRRETSQQGGSLGELQARCASLNGQVITFRAEIASLRMQLEQSSADAAMLRDESSSKDVKITQLRSDLEASRSELDALEAQVTSDLTSLASQHTEAIGQSKHLRLTLEEAQSELRLTKNALEEAQSDLRLTKSSLTDANSQRDQLNREVVRQQEDFAARMQERMSSAQVELQSLKQRLADATAQVEQVRTKSEFELEQLRSELGGSEATVGMLREQVCLGCCCSITLMSLFVCIFSPRQLT
jgi:chromosome segregation ATPase